MSKIEIIKDKCIGCKACVKICPVGAIYMDGKLAVIDYDKCILCGACYSVCPIVAKRENYLGPAALAKLYRFVKDPRDKRPYKNWSLVNTEGGAWGCHTIFKCNDVCPKEVRPADGIEALRRTMIVEKIKRLLPFKR